MTPAELVAAMIAIARILGEATPEHMGTELSTRFTLAAETPWAETWVAPGPNPVATWELRLPKAGATFDGMFIAELRGRGIAEAALRPALTPLGGGAVEIASPPLDGGPVEVMSADCYTLPEARFCVSWQGAPARATALSLEAGG